MLHKDRIGFSPNGIPFNVDEAFSKGFITEEEMTRALEARYDKVSFPNKKQANDYIKEQVNKFWMAFPEQQKDGKWVVQCMGGRYVRQSGIVL